jgi:alpha-glucosidase
VSILLYALRGTPFVYQGEELGLPDAEIPADRIVDVDGRDPERAPIPWRPPSLAGPGAGFSEGEPWLPLAAAAEGLSVEQQTTDPRSTLALVRRLAVLRAQTPALQLGEQQMLQVGSEVLAWLRQGDGDRLLAAINFASVKVPLQLPAELPGRAALLLSSDPDRAERDVELGDFRLGPSEAVILRL